MITEPIWISTGLVALAEIGDKTQLLAFLLALRFKRPFPIILGILVATLLNHGIAAAIGVWITQHIEPAWLRWALAASFIGMAIWILVPDKMEEDAHPSIGRLGVFGTTAVAFFLAEMGDKTQVATVAMAAHYAQALAVVAGTTLGMLIADVPAVFVGDRFAKALPMRWVRGLTAGLFAILGLAVLVGTDSSLLDALPASPQS